MCRCSFCQEAEADVVIGFKPTASKPGEVETQNLEEEIALRIKDGTTVKFQAQSGMETNILKIDGDVEQQNVKFSDQHDPYLYDVENAVDPTRKLMDTDDATLDNFFSRPIKIHEEEWSTSTTMYFNINPWKLYFENPRVINRIANFNLLRSRLHVKIVINGNGFQYGRAIASYLPLAAYDTLSVNAALVPQDLVQASQQPHVFLNPTTSTGGDLVLPFFYHKNYLNIPNSDWNDMGELVVRSINSLKHANGASDLVTISVFAWAEDVSLSVLTSVDPSTIVPQSGREGKNELDEANEKGIISGPATTVAKVADVLSDVPVISPFATSTSVVAKGVANVASALGYCRPPVTKDSEPFKPVSVSDLAISNNPESVRKLTVDVKQELTIDPRISGVGPADPLDIRSIASRESYLTTFDWTIGTSPETLLWNARVSPVQWAESGLEPNSFHFPACCVAAMPFEYWTGSIKFRFQIVSSAFHKGRLKFVYDPNFLASNEYNTNYLQVVDISEKNDFTITVGNGQEYSLIDHHWPGVDSVTQVHSTTPYASKEQGNGVLGVYVVNELTTPNSTVNNDIQVNVYISAGDDFEVFVPDGNDMQHFVYKPQSGKEVVPESFNTEEPDAPEHDTDINVGPGYTNHSLLNTVFTGEVIRSFRPLLKRYNLHHAYMLGTGQRTHTLRRPNFPYLRGKVAGAANNSVSGPYNFCNTVLLHWVTNCFSGYRGSFRWKVLPRTGFTDATFMVEREPEYDFSGISAPYSNASILSPTYTNTSEAANSAIVAYGPLTPKYNPSGLDGMAYQTSNVNNTFEFEAPYYSRNRFVPGKVENRTTDTLYMDNSYLLVVRGKSLLTSDIFDLYCAAGEDFQTYFWTGCPRMYYENSPPAAA
jgi:hypothetical protein